MTTTTTSEMLTVCIARKNHVDIDFCQFEIKNSLINWLGMQMSSSAELFD